MSGSAHPTVHASSISVRITALKNAVFLALSVMQKKTHVPQLLTIFGVFVKWLQMMTFLFALDSFGWERSVIEPIRVLSVIPSPAGWFQNFQPAFLQTMFYISFVWVFLFCCLTIWTVRSFLHGRIPELAPLRVLASIGQFSATVAYIPLLTMLLSVYTCDARNLAIKVANPWEGYTCYRGGHLALTILATVFAAVFACLAGLFAVVFYDSHPLSNNLSAKVHGRAELVVLLVKTMLVLGIEIFPGQINNIWAMVALNLVASVTWSGVMLYYLPLINFNMNVLNLALACVYIWGSLCLVIVTATPHVQAATLLYASSPVAVMVGVALALFRRRSVMSLPGFKLNSEYEVEMKARFTLQAAIAKLLAQSSQQPASAWNEMTGLLPSHEAQTDEASFVTSPRGVDAADTGGRFSKHARLVSPRQGISTPRLFTGVSKDADVRSKRSVAGGQSDSALFGLSYKTMDADSRERIVRDMLPAHVLAEVDNLFKEGAMRFPTSAILHMFMSRFYAVFKADRHLATSHLLLTNRLGPSLDVAYLAFQGRRAAETGAGPRVLSSAMHRISFDKHLADARLCTLNAAKAQVAFWQQLSDPCPDINALHSSATNMSLNINMAESHFKEVFLLHPQSLAAMRLFAQYNMSVANNAEKAAAISAEAERLEDQKNKEQNAQKAVGSVSRGFPFLEEVPMENMTDAVAMMTVGATSRDLGIILSANSACAKLLGYTRFQLERRNVSIIVPPPFMEDHDAYLRRYLSTGEGILVETAHHFFGKHRLGHLIPFTMLLRETTLADNTPVFTASLRQLNFSDHVVMMDEDWMVTGGTAGALTVLQIEASTLSAPEVCMADYCPTLNDAAAVTDLMGKAQGGVVQMMLPGYTSTAASKEQGDWSEQAVDVKTTLATSTIKGHTVNILTFRVLSADEKAQRARASASRRASISFAAVSAGTAMNTQRSGFGDGGAAPASARLPLRVSTRDASESVDEGSDDSTSADDASAALPKGHPQIDAALFTQGATCPVASGRRSPNGAASPASVDSIGLTITERVAGALAQPGVSDAKEERPGARVSDMPSLALSEVHGHGSKSDGVEQDAAITGRGTRRQHTSRASDPHYRSNGLEKSSRITTESDNPYNMDGEQTRLESRSVRSAGSRRSGISKGTINKLRRILSDSTATSAQEARKSVPGLSALYITGWMLVLLNIGLGALTAALLDANFAAYESNLKFAEIAADASQLQVRSQLQLIRRLNYKNGYINQTAEGDAEDMRYLMKLADQQTEMVRSMHKLVRGTPREAFFTERRLVYADYRGSVPEPISRFTLPMVRDMLLGDQFWPRTMSNGDVIIGLRKRTSLNDFTTMWSAQVKIFATTPISELTLDDHSVIFLTVNTQAGAPALEYVRSAVYESYLSTEDSRQTVGLLVVLVLWIFVAMGPVLSVLLFCLLAPILVYIDHRRDDVMEAFLDVPDLVVMHLRKGAEKRLRALRADDEDGEASDDDDDEDEAGRTAIVMGDGQPAVDMENEDGTVDWEAVVAIAARDEKLKGKPLGLAQAKAQSSTSRKPIAAAAPLPASGCCSRLSCVPSSASDQRTLCSRGARAQGGFYRSLRKSDGTVLNFIRRDFKKSRLAVMKLGVFLLPVCVMFVFYLILYLVTTNTAVQVKALTSFASLSAIRESCIRTTRTNTYFMVSSPAYPPSLAFRFEWTSMQIATLNMANRLLTYDILPDPDALDAGIVPSLTFRKAPGTELTSIAGIREETMESVRRAQGSDACEFLSRSSKVPQGFNVEECRSYNNKLLTSGLQAALQSFVVSARRLRDRRYHAAVPVTTRTGDGILVTTKTPEWAQYYNGRPIIGFADGVNFIAEGGTYVGNTPAGTAAGGRTDAAIPAVIKDGINGTLVVSITNYSVPQELASEDMRVLFDMGTKYLLPGFEELSDTYMNAGVALVLQYRVFIPAFVGGFLFLFAMGTWLLYFPAITRLGQDVQSKRAILLLLPPEVLSSIPSLKHMVLEIVAEHDGSASTTNTNVGQQVARDEDSSEEQGAQGIVLKADLQTNASGP